MREAWTDERLDDLNDRVERGFDRLSAEVRATEKRLEDRMDQRFEQVDQRFEQVDQRFEQVDRRFEQIDRRFEQVDRRFEAFDARFDALQRTLALGFGSIVASVLGATVAAIIANAV